MTSLEKIKDKDPRMQGTYQIIVFNRAVEQFTIVITKMPLVVLN